jgi:hypothetical protein
MTGPGPGFPAQRVTSVHYLLFAPVQLDIARSSRALGYPDSHERGENFVRHGPSAMTVSAPPRPAEVLSDPGSGGRVPRGGRRLANGSPLVVAFIGYPVWWILGVGEFALLAAAACMAYELIHRQEIKAPRGFGWWILFLAWVLVGIFVMQVDAPGAVPGGSGSRYFVWGYRLTWFLAATVVLLYIGNTRRHLSTRRLTEIMGWMFLVVVVGGLAGTVAPSLTFPSLLESVLPHSISSIGFVNAQIHPTFAQIYEVQRPSAPFPYANEWGLNFACFLPFFVGSWCHRNAGWRRLVAPIVLAVAVVPVIYSLNRGLWLTLAVMAWFVAVRSAATGHLRLLGALFVGALAVAVLLTATPLKGTLESRVSQEDTSNEGRTNLVSLSLHSMAAKSPIVGYGSTRNVQGTFGSISGGATVLCPLCSPPSMGTQGLIWLVAFSTGVGGLVMFLAFFVLTFLRHIRLKSAHTTLGLAVLVAFFVTLPIYDLSGPALFAVMAGVGLLWRDSVAQQMSLGSRSLYRAEEPTLRRYAALVGGRRFLVAVCVAGGIVAGAGWQSARGSASTASVSIFVPTITPLVTLSVMDQDPDHPAVRAPTLDTEAQLATDQDVRSAVDRAERAAGSTGSGRLSISATANSRILHIAYTARSATAARTGVEAAVSAYLDARTASLRAERAEVLSSLDARSDALDAALHTVDRRPHLSDRVLVRNIRTGLLAQAERVSVQSQRVRATPLQPGRIVSETSVHHDRDGWLVALSSGAMLGLLAGISLGRLPARRRPARVRADGRPIRQGQPDIPSTLYPTNE